MCCQIALGRVRQFNVQYSVHTELRIVQNIYTWIISVTMLIYVYDITRVVLLLKLKLSMDYKCVIM